MLPTGMMTVEDAFGLFHARATACGVADLVMRGDAEAFGSRYATARVGGGALRLVWDGRAGALALEVTHGSPGLPPSWLDLFHVRELGGVVPSEERGVGFEAAVEYGLELLRPERGRGAA